MIDVLPSIIDAISPIEALGGRVYRRWPKTKAKTPACIVSRISATPTLTDADGSEIIAQMVYSIDINASDADQADAIAEQVIDRLAGYNFHRTGDMDFYDDALRVYRRILTFMGSVDRRGNTFRQ